MVDALVNPLAGIERGVGMAERKVTASGGPPPATQVSSTASRRGRGTGLSGEAFRSPQRTSGRGPSVMGCVAKSTTAAAWASGRLSSSADSEAT